SLTFPGAIYSAANLLVLARDVILNWFIVASILLVLGYASGYVGLFPIKMVLTWLLIVPGLVFVTHATAGLLLPKVMALEGLHKIAVIAGANDLGARLARQLQAAPLLGIQVAGLFDDRSAERRVSMEGVPSLGNLAALSEYVKSHHVDLIYVTL